MRAGLRKCATLLLVPGVLVFAIAMSLLASIASAVPATPLAAAAAGGGVQPPADSATVKRIRTAGKLVGGIGQVLPWTLLDKNTNQWFGATVVIAREIAKRIGVPLELKPVGNDIVVQEVAAGNIDLALYPLYVNTKRLEVIDMVPWHKGGFCYLVLKSNTKINSVNDLNSKDVRMQVFDGHPQSVILKQKYPNITIVSRPMAGYGDTGVPDILAGRADATPVDNPTVFVFLAEYAQFKSIPDAKTCLSDPDIPTPIALGSPKGDSAFDSFLQALYDEMAPSIKAELAKYSDPKYLKVGK